MKIGRKPRPVVDEPNSQLRWGATGIVVAIVGLAISAVIYLVPFGTDTYVADFRSAGGARSGNEVRVAGIKVGSVQSVRLVGDHVEVRFAVDQGVHVGDLSAVEIKMLTPIGGHYLALSPAGDDDLGSAHIPPERTKTPYEITDIMQDATPMLRQVDGTTLRATITEVNKAMAGQPEAVRNLLNNVNDLTGVLAQRSDQLDQGLRVSDEYIAAIADDQAVLADFVRQLGIVAVKLGSHKDDVVQTFQLLRRLADVVHRPIMAYADGLEPPIAELEEVVNKVFADTSKLDEVIAGIQEFMTSISAMLGIENAHADELGGATTDAGICIPSAMREC
ncbi:MlaD family protein [Antrihabitans sp. YC2-6]|uniref:MlaD family protein n=1 Tax=Antrihabitans sp. YC2-6 TaxID=2799498 RepID=UPI0018F77035|nr:MCE family protein [Antrihabitans sp. YC2-6]MBJ8344786.1 MCE family protein [Antrihabitans sp. YC2-6]